MRAYSDYEEYLDEVMEYKLDQMKEAIEEERLRRLEEEGEEMRGGEEDD